MIAYLKGILQQKNTGEAIILCSGVGYLVNISMNTYDKLPEIGSETELRTILIPREDSLNLFGFFDISEMDTFKLLISIQGIGPKIALGILSSITPAVFQSYISTNNSLQLQKLPGIGKKTAERVLLELKDKILKLDIQSEVITSSNKIADEALSALISLGYNKVIAEKAVKNAENELKTHSSFSIEDLIKTALKFAMK